MICLSYKFNVCINPATPSFHYCIDRSQDLDAGVVSQAQHTQWDLVTHGRALAARVHILPLTPPTLVTSGTTEMGMMISSATPVM